MLAQFLELLTGQADRGIYVWGGNGELLSGMADPEKWIRRHETSAQNGERAVSLYRKRVSAGEAEIRAFDCSGLVHYAMKNCGARRGDLSSRGFFAACSRISKDRLLPGDLVFRRNGAGTICHVGVYVVGGDTIECYGRDVGVVRRVLQNRWSDFGRYPTLADEQAALAAGEGTPTAGAPRQLSVQEPFLRGDDVRRLQTRLIDMGADLGGAGVDGVYGNDTAEAVRSFKERAAKLTPNSVADEGLLTLLGLWGRKTDG